MAKKRKADYDKIIAFAKAHREMLQSEIAKHFGLSQCRISHILTAAGERRRRRGRTLKRKSGVTELQYEWEKNRSCSM